MIRLKHMAILVLGCIALGCAGYSQPKARWPASPDGKTRIPFQIVREGSVQDLRLVPFTVAPMSAASESAWREALDKVQGASAGRLEFVEVAYLQPAGTDQGVIIYDSPALSGSTEGVVEFYAPGSVVERMRAYCAPPGRDIRIARYWRLHEVLHIALRPHSANPKSVMFPWRPELFGAPPVEVTREDAEELQRAYGGNQ